MLKSLILLFLNANGILGYQNMGKEWIQLPDGNWYQYNTCSMCGLLDVEEQDIT